MSNPAFPFSTKNFLVSTNDLQETGTEVSLRTTMDSGRIKVRKRFTTVPQLISGSLGSLTSADVTTLMNFWLTTCGGGSIAFDWIHPRTKASTTYLFVARPVVKQMDPNSQLYYVAQLQLQIVT
jgi:hypothetical protein